jgi:hypothetical protein
MTPRLTGVDNITEDYIIDQHQKFVETIIYDLGIEPSPDHDLS